MRTIEYGQVGIIKKETVLAKYPNFDPYKLNIHGAEGVYIIHHESHPEIVENMSAISKLNRLEMEILYTKNQLKHAKSRHFSEEKILQLNATLDRDESRYLELSKTIPDKEAVASVVKENMAVYEWIVENSTIITVVENYDNGD